MMRGAIMGMGKIAHQGHLPAYADPLVRSRAEIVAAVDPSPESRAASAALHPSLRFYATPGELFRHETIDFVDICAPPVFHPALITSSLSAGVHILCEKPFAASLSDAERTTSSLAACPAVVFLPCHQYRYSPVWKTFKEALQADGQPAGCLLQCHVYRTKADPGYPTWDPSWRTNAKISGGGILADSGIHYLYLASWLMGAPEKVTARTGRLALAEGNVEDTAMIILESPGGMTEVTLSWAAAQRANSARLEGPRQTLLYDGTAILRQANGCSELLPMPDASNKKEYVALYAALIDEFLARVESGDRSGDGIRDALASIRLLDACYRSATSGCTISMDWTR